MNYRWATKCPSQHLVGKQIGPVRVALYAGKRGGVRRFADVESGMADWIAPDDALPDHPSVLCRKRPFPKTSRVTALTAFFPCGNLFALGLGVGTVLLFLADGRSDVMRLTEALDQCETELVADPSRVAASAPGCCGLFAFGSGAEHAVRVGRD